MTVMNLKELVEEPEAEVEVREARPVVIKGPDAHLGAVED